MILVEWGRGGRRARQRVRIDVVTMEKGVRRRGKRRSDRELSGDGELWCVGARVLYPYRARAASVGDPSSFAGDRPPFAAFITVSSQQPTYRF